MSGFENWRVYPRCATDLSFTLVKESGRLLLLPLGENDGNQVWKKIPRTLKNESCFALVNPFTNNAIQSPAPGSKELRFDTYDQNDKSMLWTDDFGIIQPFVRSPSQICWTVRKDAINSFEKAIVQCDPIEQCQDCVKNCQLWAIKPAPNADA